MFQRYDEMVQAGLADVDAPGRWYSTGPRRSRAVGCHQTNVARTGRGGWLVARLAAVLEEADDMSLDRIRPYALADHWQVPRKEVLTLCLLATRAGLLDFQWDLLCPACRNARESVSHLGDVGQTVHCHTCQIDYTANFSQSVELTFRPNPAIRVVSEHQEYCMSGPASAPHIAGSSLPPGMKRLVRPGLANRRYRLRTMRLPGEQLLQSLKRGRRKPGWSRSQPVGPRKPIPSPPSRPCSWKT
ncbi:MAG: DUF5939 domain-containing protein [Chloroflexi bacterium]|nr:DUF5939 domain-containing protein [Chloroflexota bacterium]